MTGARDSVLDCLTERLAEVGAPRRICVGFSGGGDSTVLLHALVSLRARFAIELQALHVDHQLVPESARWAQHCLDFCRGNEIPCRVLTVDARAGAGEGPEAAARAARYCAWSSVLGVDQVLATAHHADDRVETVLLHLLRGSGPTGLAAMPAWRRLGAGWLWRPLLEIDVARLRTYARERGLSVIDDPSNHDLRLDRNFLRHRIVPELRSRWPGLVETVGRVSAQQREVSELLSALAQSDLAQMAGDAHTLDCGRLDDLSPPRARNLIRRWLSLAGIAPPHRAHLQHILDGVVTAAPDRQPVARWPGGEVRRHRGALHAMPPLPASDPSAECRWFPDERLSFAVGRLDALPARGAGLATRWVEPAGLQVRFRQGGERCRPLGRQHSQTLKRLFQEHGVEPWLRDRIPLVYSRGQLAAVAGRWVCHGFEAKPEEPGWVFRFSPS